MKRKLTIRFHRAVSDPKLETLEVVVTPLTSANHPENDQTILGLKQTRKVTLQDPVTVVEFQLAPTYQVGLDRPIMYRIAWRRGSFGRIESTEFAMPDQNVDFDDLFDLGHIITGENYLTQDDMGVPGGVARLNEQGQVLDANGNVILSGDTAGLWAALNSEVALRTQADSQIRSDLGEQFNQGLTALNASRQTALVAEGSRLQNLITGETNARVSAISGVQNQLTNTQTSITTTANTLRTEFAAADLALDLRKADLVNGKIPANQIPNIALGTAVAVDNEAEMLQLTLNQVQPGDLAIRPDGTFILVGSVPGDPESWKRITSENAVSSVNGQTGAVTLSYNDVGARSATAMIPMTDVLGLDSALASKANGSQVTNLQTQINATNSNLSNLTTTVNGMSGAWNQAVTDANNAAAAASGHASAAQETANTIVGVENEVTTVKNDILGLQTQINATATTVAGHASQITTDRDLIADYSAAVITAAAIINDRFNDLGDIVNSVNGVSPDANGNVSIFGGGTTLSLVEDPDNPGLYHVVGQ